MPGRPASWAGPPSRPSDWPQHLKTIMTKKTQDKIDLYKQHKNEYAAPGKPVLVEIKPAVYLVISGQGAPGGERFTASIGALYGAAFTIKMTRKFAGKQDYAAWKLEGQRGGGPEKG